MSGRAPGAPVEPRTLRPTMTITDLAERLRRMIDAAPDDRKTAMIHVFGIIFADEIDHYGGAAIARAYQTRHNEKFSNPAALTDGRL